MAHAETQSTQRDIFQKREREFFTQRRRVRGEIFFLQRGEREIGSRRDAEYTEIIRYKGFSLRSQRLCEKLSKKLKIKLNQNTLCALCVKLSSRSLW